MEIKDERSRREDTIYGTTIRSIVSNVYFVIFTFHLFFLFLFSKSERTYEITIPWDTNETGFKRGTTNNQRARLIMAKGSSIDYSALIIHKAK